MRLLRLRSAQAKSKQELSRLAGSGGTVLRIGVMDLVGCEHTHAGMRALCVEQGYGTIRPSMYLLHGIHMTHIRIFLLKCAIEPLGHGIFQGGHRSPSC